MTEFEALAEHRDTIRKARSALAKWRANVASPLPWGFSGGGTEGFVVDAEHADIVQVQSREADSWGGLFSGDDVLIVGTAGNPALWDALDGFLEMIESGTLRDRQGNALRIATAIVDAEERMNA